MSERELPKPPKGTRCSALDMNGRRCRNKAVRQENYHGDHELYSGSPSEKSPVWVRVAFCEKHIDD